MQAILAAAHEQRRCWRLANPTSAEEAVHWALIQAGFVLHADYTATWEWSRHCADPARWPFTATDAVVEARVGTYACDLLFPTHALVIEVIGGIHRLTAERDGVRCAELTAQGLTVITLTNAQVFAGAADQLCNQLLEVPYAA
jgi:hypothetical protein